MLKSNNRLRDKNAIQALMTKGKWIKNEHFTLKYGQGATSPEARIAVVVSAKIDKRATERNRLRRRITEILRKLPFLQASSYQCVLIPRPSSVKLAHAELTESLKDLLSKLH